jgi:glycosyltransferase involved in cell wall biosynthesis
MRRLCLAGNQSEENLQKLLRRRSPPARSWSTSRYAWSKSLLCVVNFPPNTGYAWDFIEGIYADVADRLIDHGVRTLVAYPKPPGMPRALAESAAIPVELDVRFDELRCIRATLAFIRKNNVRAVYLPDRPVWSPAYLLLRLAGVRRILVHDHTSGERTIPRGAKRFLKRLRGRVPGTLADVVIAVSDFVLQRTISVALVPSNRVRRVWNSVTIPQVRVDAKERLRSALGLPSDRPIIGCACRAAYEKGVQYLLQAFDALPCDERQPAPVLVYFGEGPALPELEQMRANLGRSADVFFAGYRADAADLLAGADVCVVPSVWEEAFGLSVLEPMARGIPVVASRVGAIPEIVVDGETGRLVPPGDATALAAALTELLRDEPARRRMGDNGRRRVHTHFSRARQLSELLPVIKAAAL